MLCYGNDIYRTIISSLLVLILYVCCTNSEENIRAQARAGEADKKVSSLQSQLEPLRKQLEALGSEKDALENDKYIHTIIHNHVHIASC